MSVLKMKIDNIKINSEQNQIRLDSKEYECRRIIAKIIHKFSNKSFHVLYAEHQIETFLSASCIIQPENDDIVEVLLSFNKAYIVSVLERSNNNLLKYILHGDVTLGAGKSNISINSKEIEIKSSKMSLKSNNMLNISVENAQIEASNLLEISAENRETNINGLDLHTAETISQKSSQINITSNKFNINS
ncbi:MAG: hypothetical protein ACJA0H_001474 [Francisellaceae bacterium]|jgi:hypothetical protein